MMIKGFSYRCYRQNGTYQLECPILKTSSALRYYTNATTVLYVLRTMEPHYSNNEGCLILVNANILHLLLMGIQICYALLSMKAVGIVVLEGILET